MLPAQVSYWELQETIRHNKEVELANSKNAESNRIQAVTANFAAREQARHNRESESISWFSNYETKRHNLQQERLGFETLSETKRHNLRTEDLTQQEINELVRHNQMNEAIGWENAAASRRSATAAIMSAQAAQSQASAAHKQANVAQQRANTDRWVASSNIARNATLNRVSIAQIANYQADTTQEYSKANYYNAKTEYTWKDIDWYLLNNVGRSASGIARDASKVKK